MKRLLAAFFIVAMAFSLLVSCSPDTPAPVQPKTESTGEIITPEVFESVLAANQSGFESVGREMAALTKIKADIILSFPNGIRLVTEEDYKNAKADGITPTENAPLTYKWITISASSTKDEAGNLIADEETQICYSTLDEPTKEEDYIDAKSGSLSQELEMLFKYHMVAGDSIDLGSLLNYIFSTVKPTVKVIGTFNIYLGDDTQASIVLAFDDFELSANGNRIDIKGEVKTSKNVDNDYNLSIDASLEFGKNFSLKFSKTDFDFTGDFKVNVNSLSVTLGPIAANIKAGGSFSFEMKDGMPILSSCNAEVELKEMIGEKEFLSLDVALNASAGNVTSFSGLIAYLKIYEARIDGVSYSADSIKALLLALASNEK